MYCYLILILLCCCNNNRVSGPCCRPEITCRPDTPCLPRADRRSQRLICSTDDDDTVADIIEDSMIFSEVSDHLPD